MEVWSLRPTRSGAFGRECFCETEVEHLDHAIGRDLDVGGFEIAMDDSCPVGGVEGVGDLLRDGQCLREWQRPPADAISPTCRPRTNSSTRDGHVGGVFETVDCSDVWDD